MWYKTKMPLPLLLINMGLEMGKRKDNKDWKRNDKIVTSLKIISSIDKY